MRPPHKSSSRAAKSAPRKQLDGDATDPLFNQTVQKALSILEVFGSEKTALNLTEIGLAVGMTKSSAQRCTHTLERLGYLRRDPQVKRWVLTPRALGIAHAYLSGHVLLEQATTHLIDLNQTCGESVSLSEPDDTDMVYIARFPSHKRFLIHMPVGRRLPMYCAGAGRAYLSALPRAEAQRIVRRSTSAIVHADDADGSEADSASDRRRPGGGLCVDGAGILPRRPDDRGTRAGAGRPARRGHQYFSADEPLDARRNA